MTLSDPPHVDSFRALCEMSQMEHARSPWLRGGYDDFRTGTPRFVEHASRKSEMQDPWL